MKKAWSNYFNIICMIFFSLALIKPFHISAVTSDYFIGYNYRIIEYDVNTISSFTIH